MSAMSSRMALLRSRMLLNFLKSTEKGTGGFPRRQLRGLIQTGSCIGF